VNELKEEVNKLKEVVQRKDVDITQLKENADTLRQELNECKKVNEVSVHRWIQPSAFVCVMLQHLWYDTWHTAIESETWNCVGKRKGSARGWGERA